MRHKEDYRTLLFLVWVIGVWIFEFICYLFFVAWNFFSTV
ncbi:hypothetical protein D1AOALGA4SA_3831 [Olavius algarvensis Delta 1 endosymbiont]|nr:hypothetical protein D1AOALGA4SA_3831 [Olavius algarvensis Delta 1 endosymbiont]